MRTRSSALAAALLSSALSVTAHAQYNTSAGASRPMTRVPVAARASDGRVTYHDEYRAPAADRYGNAAGSQYDLAVDGAFAGQTVAVLQLYNFDFENARGALREKGFSVYRWSNATPTPAVLRESLARANQFWLISGSTRTLTDAHVQVIREFFNAGHGVYIWGDNEPYYADANALAEGLFGGRMEGNLIGSQVVPLQGSNGGPGILRDHLLSTGLEQLFEGITIATIQPNDALRPLLYGSARNLVTAFYDHDGRRAILDGGFTRLYNSWDTAGTARYVKNSAAWLANAERFGAAVVAQGARAPAAPAVAAPPAAPPPTPAAAPRTSQLGAQPTPWQRQAGLGLLGAVFLFGLAFSRQRAA
jgi:hypothetical protein